MRKYKRKRRKWHYILISLIILLFTLFTLTFRSPNKVVEINIEGTISSSPILFSKSFTVREMINIVERIRNEPSIKSVLVTINSPGGSVVASREIYLLLKSINAKKVCWISDIATSGAYWIALGCDKIIADPLSITGSIGVTASYLRFSRFMEKYGIDYERLVSGDMKDFMSPFKNMSIEERNNIEYIINETFSEFWNTVLKERRINKTYIDEIKSGKVFLGKDAAIVGLIDETGDYVYAKNIAKKHAGEFVVFEKISEKRIGLLDILNLL